MKWQCSVRGRACGVYSTLGVQIKYLRFVCSHSAEVALQVSSTAAADNSPIH